MALSYTYREQIEVYRFGSVAAILIPGLAILFQSFLPLWFPFFLNLDLPLLVVIFFAMARRSQVSGLLTGATVGLLQDMLTNQPIGLYGIAKTVVGYGASSLGVKLNVESVPTRLILTTGFYVVHEVVYFAVAKGMVRLHPYWSWPHELEAALANAVLGVPLFAVLDRLKRRA